MSADAPSPTRWRDLPPGSGIEFKAAALIEQMGDPDLPGDDRLAAIRSRIVLRRGPRVVRRRFTWAVTIAALLIGGTLGAAARDWIAPIVNRFRTEPRIQPLSRPTRTAGKRITRPPDPVPPSASASPSSPSPAPQPGPPPPAPSDAPLPRNVSPRLALASPPAPASPETSAEAAALGTAIRKLRRQGDARGALAALNEYDAAFPRGELGAEADLVRVEALLAIGERAAALRLLDARAVESSPRARQSLLVRGELRAATGRCADATADLTRVLVQPPRDGLDERALFARASCRSRLHDTPGARRDLETYLRHFPTGPQAGAATAALQSLPATH
jgi:hypothetical protein